MNIPVLIEPISNNGFRATGGLPFEITVEGATRDEALGRLRAEIDKRMACGAIVVPLETTPTEDHPWVQGAGMFRDNPLFVFIPLSLVGLLEPRKGRQFIAWRREPQELAPDPRGSRAPERGRQRGLGWWCLIAIP